MAGFGGRVKGKGPDMATTERVTVSAVTCDRCGGDVPEAAACWEMATPVCPPCFLAETDTDPAEARFRAEYWAAWHSRDVEQHAVDGFTLWWTDSAGVFRHRRFIGYTVSEAVELAARHVAGGGQ